MRALDCLGIDSQCSSARLVGRRASQDHQPADSRADARPRLSGDRQPVFQRQDAHRKTISKQIAERMRALDCLGIDSQCSSARSVGQRASRDHQPTDSRVDVRPRLSGDRQPVLQCQVGRATRIARPSASR
ncbi:UPF0193 protein EVG1-like protein [Operophtera brumata]|uniref:UPF0193 protein EVG1-like protein n=1 Tax=Operophtera brumata TaxID=104452 RepID=A0A0L7KZ40_OPEBR|nr:UPF0193 protein EVG1-like protein [Operophtera brumata]